MKKSDIIREVSKVSTEDIFAYMQRTELTHDELVVEFMKLEKEKLVEMLIESNRINALLAPKISLVEIPSTETTHRKKRNKKQKTLCNPPSIMLCKKLSNSKYDCRRCKWIGSLIIQDY